MVKKHVFKNEIVNSEGTFVSSTLKVEEKKSVIRI